MQRGERHRRNPAWTKANFPATKTALLSSMPAASPSPWTPGRALFVALLVTLLAGLAGCVTPPPTFKTRPEAAAKLATLKRIAIAPPDVEVREISAGGVPEVRDDWTAQVATTLGGALAAASGFAPPVAPAAMSADELKEVQALIRLITVNHLTFLFGPKEFSPTERPLTYALGRIDALADAAGGADALLFVFARDAYSSAGRKALVALGFAMPAPAVASAMLVERDGTVEWFNYHFTENTDLRTTEGARALGGELLKGLQGQ
jgi:hypothetical protein